VFWWKEVGYDGKHDQSQAKIEEYTLNNMVRDFTYYCTFPDPPMIASASPSKPKPTHPFSAMIFQALSLIILSAIAHLFGFPPPRSSAARGVIRGASKPTSPKWTVCRPRLEDISDLIAEM